MFKPMNAPKQKQFEETAKDQHKGQKYLLILHNDDENTFEFVTESLINVCDHDPFQAEQCAYLAHHKGKCDIKSGSLNRMKALKHALTDRGLTISISQK